MKLINWIKTLPQQHREKSYTLGHLVPDGGITFALIGKRIHEALHGAPPVPAEPEDLPPVQHVLRLKYEVCTTCGGKGSHVNPSIDAHGLTREDFDEDPDFEEEYQSGMYDVSCYECGGRTTALCIDRDRTPKKALEAADSLIEDHADFIRESEAERRMGA